jgi:hypothetical protein
MSDEDKSATSKLVHAGVSIAAGAATGGPAGAIVAAGQEVATALWDAFKGRGQRRTAIWFATIVEQSDAMSTEEITKLINERAADPALQGVVLDHVRHLLDAVDDCVVPALGTLAAQYLCKGRPVDDYFRGLSRVLCDLSFREFRGLQSLANGLANLGWSTPIRVYLAPRQEDMSVIVRPASGPGSDDEPPVVQRVVSARRLIYLLKIQGLAEDDDAWLPPNNTGTSMMVIEAPIAERIAQVVGCQAT